MYIYMYIYIYYPKMDIIVYHLERNGKIQTKQIKKHQRHAKLRWSY